MNLEEQLRRDEDEVLHAYTDSLGYLTIGVGRLIDKRRGGGLSKAESAMLLANDIKQRESDLDRRLPWWRGLTTERQAVLVNMCFQLGIDGLSKFTRTLAHIQAGRYSDAASEMKNSKWHEQTPARAKRLAKQMETSQWQ